MKITDAQIRQAVRELGTQRKAAKYLGVDPAIISRRLAMMKDEPEITHFSMSDLPKGELDYPELVTHLTKRFKAKDNRERAKRWRSVNINIGGPVCLVGMGDPHIDDDGCNWPLLSEHVDILNEEGMLPINIGDTNNNWIGRLARLYSKQGTTEEQSWILVEGFLQSVPWLVVLQGNHGMWSGSGSAVKWIVNQAGLILENWKSDFELKFKNVNIRVSVAHDFPGHSMYNNTHGPLRRAKMGGEADIYICGHRHSFGEQIIEQNGKLSYISRARGYKRYDEYAEVNGFAEGDFATSVCYIIDPDAPLEERIIFLPSLKKASKLLKLMRADWKKKGKKK